jgi:subtilisin family serine protease
MKLFLSSLLLCTFFNFTCSAQQGQINIIVKFNYYYLDFEKIDDPHLTTFQFNDILNSNAKKYIDELEVNIPGISNFAITKIFKNLTTKDTISISRQGEKISIPPFWAAFTLTIPDTLSITRCISILNDSQPLIEYCHYNFPAYLQTTPDDTLYHKQISYNGSSQLPDAGIEVEHAWEIETGKPFIKVGVHDSGIDTLHPDLDVIFGGSYFEPYSNHPLGWGEDLKVHGTPVAGIIAAKRNNLTGIAGIAGGDGHSDSGCSLIDLRINFYDQNLAAYICASVVDAARSVGTYWDYPDTYYEDPYLLQAPGFGVHIGNHSYIIKTNSPIPQNPREDSTSTKFSKGESFSKNINDSLVAHTPVCNLCREAYLFSYRNGVINVVARGNSSHFTPSTDPTIINNCYPQSFPDNWIISIGASGYDGNTVQQGLNQSAHEEQISYWSMYGGNMDLIAPGSDSIVYTTHVIHQNTISNPYMKMNGTSAAAPHVSGVAALLLSHYNKDCYSNRNLAVEDVEYILENSATNLYSTGYDDTTGWGRLNAYKALQMIENPTKQIVHPDSVINTEIINIDTIALSYKNAFVGDGWGPLSNGFPLENHREYEVERYLIQNTYSFSEYYTSSTNILGYWIRPSASNALKLFEDTIKYISAGTPAGALYTFTKFDFFDPEPYVQIVEVDSLQKTIKTRGYFYHFIKMYADLNLNASGITNEVVSNIPDTIIDDWLPINPLSELVKIPISLYLSDANWLSYFDSPCTAENPLFDTNYGVGIEEISKSEQIKIFPNPSREKVNLINLHGLPLGKFEIFDLSGRMIYLANAQESNIEIDLSQFESGTYTISFLNAGLRSFEKIIKL